MGGRKKKNKKKKIKKEFQKKKKKERLNRKTIWGIDMEIPSVPSFNWLLIKFSAQNLLKILPW